MLMVLAGCASGPKPVQPGVPEATHHGYQCSDDTACEDTQRCHLRMPSSVGRCVSLSYYTSHPRGCFTDNDCQKREICTPIEGQLHGECNLRFRHDKEAEQQKKRGL